MSKEQAIRLNQEVEHMSLGEVLGFCSEQFKDTLSFATSMGAEDQVITHTLSLQALPVDVFTLDTGRMFAETYDLIDKTQARYNIKIRIMFPDAAEIEKMVNEKGINLFYKSIENRKLCCGLRKIKPLKRALAGKQAWITGLRREQSTTRTDLKMVEWDESFGLIKINPLLEWSERELWDYIKENNIPYNSLHDQKFPSIGCQPCTRAVLPGEDIRSGRWWWENPQTRECGLHKK